MAESSASVAQIVAGFIVWLAHERVDVEFRRRCPTIAERFLRWQTDQRNQHLPETVEDYCDDLAADGSTEQQITENRAAIVKLMDYLEK